MILGLPLPCVVRCSHPHCRTSLSEAGAVYCPHGLAFCPVELWEEVCSECAG